MIEIKNLCKNYGQLKIYDNFNLDLFEGEITCILGESGSGKTTFLNCIARLTDFKGQIPVLRATGNSFFFSVRLIFFNIEFIKSSFLQTSLKLPTTVKFGTSRGV